MKDKRNSFKEKLMNILLWVLQILFAFYYVAGGIYMTNHYKILANEWALKALPGPFWIILGLLQVLFGLGLVFRKFVVLSAISLIIISLLGIVLYDAYTGSGILWSFFPSVVLVFIAYGRRLKN